jgi:mRNA-degrading endonuclease toxin of MazEF toxin-antitoxin module
VKRGDVWWGNLPEPWGRRPVLLLARDHAYSLLTWVIVAPVTTRRRNLPTTVPLDPSIDGVPEHCVVNLDNLQAIRVAWLDRFIVRLSEPRMQQIEQAIHFALDLSS